MYVLLRVINVDRARTNQRGTFSQHTSYYTIVSQLERADISLQAGADSGLSSLDFPRSWPAGRGPGGRAGRRWEDGT